MRKIPLRLWFLGIMTLLLLIFGVLLAGRVFINHSFVSAYDNEEYRSQEEEKLLKFNFPESYVPYYNLGNAAYKNGDYNSAISYFTEALKHYPSEKKDCLIRINLALSMLGTIDFYNLDSQEKIDTALFVLYKARDVLLENGCATDEGDGHNADAQQLKEDIDKMIEMLKNPDQNQNNNQQDDSGNSDSDDDSDGGSNPSDREKRAQKELEENKKDALEDRKNQQGDLKKWSDYVGDEDGSGSDGDEVGGGKEITNPW